MTADEFLFLDACALSGAIRGRQVSCREVMQATLARIDRLNPRFNAIVSLQPAESLLAQADERDAQLARGEWLGWMHGFPQAVKDLANTRGIRTTLGSPLLQDFVPREDALIVERARRVGAIVIGKTNVPEFGLGSQTYNSVFGATANAWDPSMCAGGSSGGAAVALALRMLPVADGSDMGGSLRNPAAYNNVFGLRPSAGRVPKYPAVESFIEQLGTEGPMARSVADLAMLLSVQAGHDPRAPLSLAEDPAVFAGPLARDCRGLRVGWLGDLGGHLPFDPGVLELCGEGLRALEAVGCVVEETPLGFAPERLWAMWLTLRSCLVSGARQADHADPARRARMKPEAVWEVENGLKTSALDVYRASVERTAWYRHALGLFERFDFLALPAAQVFPFDLASHWPREVGGRTMDTYHRWMEVVIGPTLAGLPAISVPVGFDARGLPMGMQLIGRPRGDLEVLQLAHAYEQAAPWARQAPAAARG
ncbi:amidase [Quisquiliibacterium transsilvanicum]|uniref:Amidase n=1 Tax=Quisquiliibacterium transsilvanicum TaxID=1549638 RepID=A0A7W8MAA3_9BURK|nr:amidase [Quisquiliibacterium transsilvanicum]MBB5273175.1 amidase [Quisquiliibacterium transsilvanicum]